VKWNYQMDIGMLWFDNDPQTDLPNKIDRAAAFYQSKYGQAPTLCYLNPKMLGKDTLKHYSIEVKTNQSILHHHLWIGVAAEKEGKAGQ
jgi:hypothetical protein